MNIQHPTRKTLRATALGFTMVEMLLVVTMMGIVTLMSIPNLVKSIRANRLRTAARTVVATGKYARSMAVLRQAELRLVFNIDAGRIEVAGEAGRTKKSGDLLLLEEEEAEIEKEGQPQLGANVLSRTLKNARIEYVDIEDVGATSEGSCSVPYRRNGRCTPYSVVLVDKRGTRKLITVDSLSTARSEER